MILIYITITYWDNITLEKKKELLVAADALTIYFLELCSTTIRLYFQTNDRVATHTERNVLHLFYTGRYLSGRNLSLAASRLLSRNLCLFPTALAISRLTTLFRYIIRIIEIFFRFNLRHFCVETNLNHDQWGVLWNYDYTHILVRV